jgi:hypothetical protein
VSRSRAALLVAALSAWLSCGDDIKGPPEVGLVPCTSPSDCEAPTPMCDPQAQICVGCIASQQTCGAGLTCDETTYTCVPADPDAPCRFDADCPRPGFDTTKQIFCDLDTGRCVGCLDDLDCIAPQICLPDSELCGEFCDSCPEGWGCDEVERECIEPDAGPG